VSTASPATAARRPWAPRVAAVLVTVVALFDLLAVLRPGLAHRFEDVRNLLPGVFAPVSVGLSVVVSMLLLLLAHALALGKRRAWRVAVVLVAAQVVLHLTQHRWPITLVSLLLLVLLIVTRDQFAGRSDPTSRRQVLVAFLVMFVASLVVGLLFVYALARDEHLSIGVVDALVAVLLGLVGIPSTATTPESRASDAVYYVLLLMGAATVGITALLAFRSARTPRKTDDDRRDVQALLAAYGDLDSLSYFAARDDRAVSWTPDRAACVTYKVVSGTALVAGDPLGPRDRWAEAVTAFVDVSLENAWVPAAAAVSAEGAAVWAEVGAFSSLEFGDEAILDETFTLQGRAMRNVRQAAARAARAGNVVVVSRSGHLTPERAAQVGAAADEWRDTENERGYTMSLGRFDPARDPDSVVVTCDVEGELTALLVFVPWGADGISLDLMRRSDSATNGVTELMISTLMESLSSRGIVRVSLNFAVFREVIERAESPEAGTWDRLVGRAVQGVSSWSQADSLYRFNAKFHPGWAPRYLIYRSATELPRVGLAYLDAESFVPWATVRPGLDHSGA
jgi:lysyl-tRNA synthetase, class II